MGPTHFLIVAKNTDGMLTIEKTLRKNGIECQMVPAPPESGTVCAIAIKVLASLIESAKNILIQNHVSYYNIFEDKKLKLQGLLDKKLGTVMSEEFIRILTNIELGEELLREEIVYLLKTDRPKEIDAIFSVADRIRREIVGDVVEIRGAIEFSNYCRKNCHYCGLAASNNTVNRYRMSKDEILAVVMQLHEVGIKTVVLQSGEDPFYTVEWLMELIHEIKQRTRMGITLSIGERTYDEYKLLRQAGANNFLLKIEAANRTLFQSVHPDDDYDTRVKCTSWLKELGYLLGSGNIIGLPGQTLEDIADDILYFKEMGINMIGIGPFVPASGSELENLSHGDVDLTLRTVAITRIVCKRVFIPSTTALASIDPDAQVRALHAGANSIMLINTPPQYRNLYRIYDQKNMVDLQDAIETVKKTNRKLPPYLKIESITENPEECHEN